MANRCIFPVALLLLFTGVLARSYPLHQQRNNILDCMDLLRQLNGSSADCLKQRMNSKIPEELKHPQLFQQEDLLPVTYQMFLQTLDIFNRNFSTTGWNNTVIEELRNQLYLQETILNKTMEERNLSLRGKSILNLKKYYFSLMRYLKLHKYNSCAWIIIKVQVLQNFSYLHQLISYFSD